MNKFLLLVFFLSLSACSGNIERQENAALHAEIETLKSALRKATVNTNGQLVHIVYFSLKKDLTEAQKATFIEELNRLSSIEGVRDFQAGSFAELGDSRALQQYDAAILMEFDSEAEYKHYQQHPTHLDVKNGLGAYLAAPPASYDFVKK